MKLFITFVITLLLAVTPQSIASSSLTVEDVHDSPTGHVSRLTLKQRRVLKKNLALDDATHKKVIKRADPLKVAKFIEIYELFKEEDIENTVTRNEEIFNRAIYYVPCEIAWHLRIIEFDEVIQCLEKSASWKAVTKVGDHLLVNFFADKHTFELIQLLKTTDVGDDNLFLSIQEMLLSEGLPISVSPAFFLQHALALYKENTQSPERREMVSSFLSLHLSAIANLLSNPAMLKALYTGLAQDVPTLFKGNLPEHAIAVAATRMKEDEYDIVIINSGNGLQNHASTTEIQPKGFHTGTSYGGFYTSKPIKAKSYNPLLRMKGITGEHLSLAHYHSGKKDEVYYVVKNASSCVVKEPLMPWEWTERQGIGTCAATSVWFALRFYYQALAYENDIRLSMLNQAIGDLKEPQDKVEGLEHQLNADYKRAWEAFKEAHKDYKAQHFDYDQSPVTDVALEKDKSEKTLHLRRTIISMALNEILRNLIVWRHELDDINADLDTKGEDYKLKEPTQYLKMTQRCRVLEKAIPQTMASFHSFWSLQEKKYSERQKAVSGEEVARSSLLDSWHSIREDVRTMYNDAIRVLKIKFAFKTVLEKEAVAAQGKLTPIDVKFLDEHSSLKQILGYIINFGDTPKLRQAISEHTEKHTKNANAAKYLLVLYACLTKDVPLLDYLIVQQKLPLRYTIDKTKRDTDVSMMYWDLKTEQSIAALAAQEFVQFGQPLNNFPQLFAMSKKETQGIIRKFKISYKKIAPIINVESPSKGDIDQAFEDFVKQGRVAIIAYILPKASKKAISDAFIETNNVKVLRLLIDLVQGSTLLKQKIEANIENVEIVEFLLPFYLRSKKHAMEKAKIKKQQRPRSSIDHEPAAISLPDHWLGDTYARNAVKVMELLAPFGREDIIKSLLGKAAKDGKFAIALVLARHATDDAISTAIEDAKTHGHAGLAEALSEEYARKNPIGVLFLKAVEHDKLDGFKKLLPNVSVGTIGYALFKAAEKGKMDYFQRLFPHSAEDSISAALSKLPDVNLRHPSVLKAATNASRLSVYKEIFDRATRASNAELIARLLPFMSTDEVDRSFVTACKNAKSFEITKHLSQFAESDAVDTCLKVAADTKMEDQLVLLLPRAGRKKLAEISNSPEFKKLSNGTRKAAANRIENFPTEVAIELAFLPKDSDDVRKSLEAELGKDKADLVCDDQQSCIKTIKSIGPSKLVLPIEKAVGRLLKRKEDNAALEKLLPFATPYACTKAVSLFSEHGSEKTAEECAEIALKCEVLTAARSAQRKDNFGLIEFLVPFLSPLGIIELLEPSSSEKIDARHVKAILANLPSDLANNALRIAVRGNKERRGETVHYLLPKALKVAIDEVYLFAKRIEFNDELLEESASVTAKAQGKEIERAVRTK